MYHWEYSVLPTWGPPGSCWSQMGPMLAPWTLLSWLVSGSAISTPTMEGLVLQVLLVVVSMLIGCIILKNRRFQLPPGPLSLPIIGTAWRLRGPDVREAMLSLARQYGDVFTMHLGGATMVILASYDVIREAYVKNGALSSGRALANIGFRAFATDKCMFHRKEWDIFILFYWLNWIYIYIILLYIYI